MTGIEKYTAPGILEEYCLGLLTDAEASEISVAIKQYPELLQKIKAIEDSLLDYRSTVDVKQPLKEKIFAALENLPLENKIDLNNPPAINRNSDLHEWNTALHSLSPDKDYGNIKVRFIKDDPEHQLCVA